MTIEFSNICLQAFYFVVVLSQPLCQVAQVWGVLAVQLQQLEQFRVSFIDLLQTGGDGGTFFPAFDYPRSAGLIHFIQDHAQVVFVEYFARDVINQPIIKLPGTDAPVFAVAVLLCAPAVVVFISARAALGGFNL